MNEDIALICTWARENGLTLSASKTHLEYCSDNNSMPKILLDEMTFKFMHCEEFERHHGYEFYIQCSCKGSEFQCILQIKIM